MDQGYGASPLALSYTVSSLTLPKEAGSLTFFHFNINLKLLETGSMQWWPVWGLLLSQLPPPLTKGAPARRGSLFIQAHSEPSGCRRQLDRRGWSVRIAPYRLVSMASFSLIYKVCGEEFLPFPSADLLLLVITLSLPVGPAHADMALNSQSTEGVWPGRTDYVFQGILA